MRHMKKPERPSRPPRPPRPKAPGPRVPLGRDRAFKAALAREYGVEELPRRLRRRTEMTLESLPNTLPVRRRPVLRAVRSLSACAAVLAVTFAALLGLNTTHPRLTEALPGLGPVFAAMNGSDSPSPTAVPAPTPTPRPEFQPVTVLSKGDFPGVLTIDSAWTDGNVLTMDMSISAYKEFGEKFGAEDISLYDYFILAPRAETDDIEPFSTGYLTVSNGSDYRDFAFDDLIFTRDDSGKFTARWQVYLDGLQVQDSLKVGLEMPDMSANYSLNGNEGAYYSYAGFSASFVLEKDASRNRVFSVHSADGPVTLRSVYYTPGRVELDVSLPYLGVIGDLYEENGEALEYPLGSFASLTCMDGGYEYALKAITPAPEEFKDASPDGSSSLDMHYVFQPSSLGEIRPQDLNGPLTLTLYEFPQNDGPLGRVTAEFTIDLSTGRAYSSRNYEKYGYEKDDLALPTRQRLENAMTNGLLLAPQNAGDAINGGAYGPYSQFTLYSDLSYSGRELQVNCYLDGEIIGSFSFVIDGGEYEDEYVQYYTYPYYLTSSGQEYLSTTVIFNHSFTREDGSNLSFDRLELQDPFSGEVLIPDLAESWRESYIELFARDPQAETDADKSAQATESSEE